ncbi:hypothetical protein KL935_003328 [Ogataea polymorpha]|nr:hypothetical protein KL935_003328 [Ogataea polymorpha]
MNIVCGVCGTHSTKADYFCGSCINFKILKLKLNITNICYLNETFGYEIDKVLQDCINGYSSKVLRKYLEGELHADAGPREKLSPSTEAIARLAYMLLAVELSQLKKNLSQADETLERQKLANMSLRAKVEELRASKSEQANLIRRKKQELAEKHQKRLKQIRATMREIEADKLDKTAKLIRQSANQHFQQLVKVSSYENMKGARKSELSKSKLPSLERLNYNIMNLRNKITPGTAGFRNALFFSPVLPLSQYLYYTSEVVITSITKVAQFVSLSAVYLNVNVPFRIVRSTQFIYIVEDACESYALTLGPPSENPEVTNSLFESTNQDLSRFCGALARLLINMVVLINATKPTPLRFENLLNLDELLQLLVGEVPDPNMTVKEHAPSPQEDNKPTRRRSIFNFWSRRKRSHADIHPSEEKGSENGSREVLEMSLYNSQHLVEYLQDQKINIQSKIASSIIAPSPSASTSFGATSLSASNGSSNTPMVPEWSSEISPVPDADWLSSKLHAFFVTEILKVLDREPGSSQLANGGLSASSTSTYQQINYNSKNSDFTGSRYKTAPLYSTNAVPVYQSSIPPPSRSRFHHYKHSKQAKTDNWEVI